MPSENDLRELMASTEAPGRIDTRRVIARSRARRRSRRLAGGAVGALALAGVAILGVQVAQVQVRFSASDMADPAVGGAESGDGDSGATTYELKRAPAEYLNSCASPLAEVAPSASGLQLDVVFPETAEVGATTVDGVVRLSNTGTDPIAGTTPAGATVTLSQDGIVLWHGGAALGAVIPVDLDPGESLEYPATVTPVRCDADDELAGAFRDDLPALPAGRYELSAAIDFSPGSGTELELVTGPRTTIELR